MLTDYVVSQPTNKITIVTEADLEPLIPNFLNNRQKDILDLEIAIAESDFETIKRIGHSMKGIGSAYGFDYITQVGADFEHEAKNKQPGSLPQFLAELKLYLTRVEIVYE